MVLNEKELFMSEFLSVSTTLQVVTYNDDGEYFDESSNDQDLN